MTNPKEIDSIWERPDRAFRTNYAHTDGPRWCEECGVDFIDTRTAHTSSSERGRFGGDVEVVTIHTRGGLCDDCADAAERVAAVPSDDVLADVHWELDLLLGVYGLTEEAEATHATETP